MKESIMIPPRTDLLKKRTAQVKHAPRSPKTISVLDQLFKELEDRAGYYGLEVDSEEFTTTWLLSCSLLRCFATALKESGVEGCENGAAYVGEAAWRLTQIGMWGRANNSVSLEMMPSLGEGWSVENLMDDTGFGTEF